MKQTTINMIKECIKKGIKPYVILTEPRSLPDFRTLTKLGFKQGDFWYMYRNDGDYVEVLTGAVYIVD